MSIVVVLAAGSLALIGCGGVVEGGVVNSGATSQLLRRADAICRRLNSELVTAKPSGMIAQGVPNDLPRHIVLEREAQNKLRNLGKLAGSPALAKGWQRVLEDRGLLVDELTGLLKAAKRGDASAIAALTTSKKHTHVALRADAARIGFRDCSVVG